MAGVKAPQHYEKVYKDECVFTFDTPFSEGGLAVNMKTLIGVAADMVDRDVQRNGGQGGLYFLQKFRRVAKEKPADAAPEEPTKLAIGVQGGFLEDKWDVVKEHFLLIVDASGGRSTIPLPCEELPMIVNSSCEAIMVHQGAKSMDDTGRWEDAQEVKESKYAKDLVQLTPTKKISPNPKDWKCEISGDTQNLWLNLSDGHIGGGRKFWDGTGGSNGAVDHFNEEKAKGNFYPLAVKLGTITPQGADVYSYATDEDDMVKDPLLAQHLAHWGIDVMKMEKTDKTLAELEVEKNLNYDWSRICESGESLVRLRGPGLVGLKNLGNSCYMNSTVQMLLTLPEARARYFDADLAVRLKGPAESATDLITQVAKVTNGLLGDRYAPPWKEGDDEDDPKFLIAPQMFRTLIGKGHPEFSSNRQQDAAEFLQYLLDQLNRAERSALGSRLEAGKPFSNLFEFAVEERLQVNDAESRVKYSRLRQNMLGLPAKLEDAENLEEITAFRAEQEPKETEPKRNKTEGDTQEPKPIIQIGSCLERWGAPEDGISFRGTTASKTSRLATMPRYLLVSVQRYYLDEKWTPTKLDCQLPMPDKLSLEHLRGRGLQPGETELPAEDSAGNAAPTAAAEPQIDEIAVASLISMGIPENAAKRACKAVQPAGAEVAASWYFEHMEDPGINDPLAATGGCGGASAGGSGGDADPEAVAMLTSMGFSEMHVKAALKSCDNNAERGADWLFSHADDLDAAVAALSGGGAGGGTPANGGGDVECDDGSGEYTLLGFVSHIGKNTSHGHYVCHMKRGEDGGWVIFDDQKVAKSEKPPLDLGYIYLYRRNDVA
eukprot:TRINITY_DN55174_c0_g1_i1.p1 TRINITY_DN55174_c0_g1~~TRINITY_DN55174_c0_g1_i1.p1  ORF type:complete len:864 (+),score=183.87 TRINITY_DN55174_c0_g1_i1:104-2593(+)